LWTTEKETVEQGILALDTQKGTRPDEISPLFLKKIVLVVTKPLAALFKLSLLSGVISYVWKESYVVLLFKRNDKEKLISILSAISKFFEKLVCDVITPIIRL
jgi:hypothetical protein